MNEPNRATRRAASKNGKAADLDTRVATLEQQVAEMKGVVDQLLAMLKKAYAQQMQTALQNPEVQEQLAEQMLRQQLQGQAP